GLRRFAGCRGAGYVDPRRRADCNAAVAGGPGRPWLPGVLDRPGTSGPGAPLAAAVAGPLRPGRLANDLGVLASHAAARGPGSTHRDLDLPQSTPTVPSGAHRQLRRAATVRIAPVRHTIRVPAVPGTIGITILRVAWTVGHRIGRRGADGIRDGIASGKQHSTLEAVVVSAAIKASESLVTPPGTYAASAQKGLLVRLAGWLGIFTLPVLVALYVGATTFDGTFMPWRPIMVDLEVYRRAGSVLLAGANFYDLPGTLQFLYPPFAAVLAVPLALLPAVVVQIGWTAAGAVALVAILHRFGLTGWLLSLAGAAVVYVVEPVVQTLAFGQL